MKIKIECGEIVVRTCATMTTLSLSDAILLHEELNDALDWKWNELLADENHRKEKEQK